MNMQISCKIIELESMDKNFKFYQMVAFVAE